MSASTPSEGAPGSAARGPRLRHIGEARPFLWLLLVSLAALGLVNRGLPDHGGLPALPLIWAVYGTTWVVLLLCSVAALTHHRRTMWREERLLSLLLSLSLAVDLVEVNVRLLQSRVAGLLLLLQAALLFVALLALFTYLYWRLDRAAQRPEQRAFWWIPPPVLQSSRQSDDTAVSPAWRPQFLDYLYLSCTISFSFFPHVDPIRPVARLLVILHLVVVFDVDLILLARAVSLIPS
jgi:Ca2+/Na+ antiporter